MKNTEAREEILSILKQKKKITPGDITYATKGKIPLVQVYAVAKKMVEEKIISVENTENNKLYSLINTKVKSTADMVEEPSSQLARKAKLLQPDKKRSLDKYKFNGVEYNKGRLALAIFAEYAREKRPTYKAAEAFFPTIPPYGFIKPVTEAKRMSKERQRFFCKDEEQVKLRDMVVCVSNQMTSDRTESIIAIARKELKFKITKV
jgi:hypothetical protein